MQNELSDTLISACFEEKLNSHNEEAICDQRRAISVIASPLEDFATALPRTYRLAVIDAQSLCAMAKGQHESNIIGFLEERGYSGKIAYLMANSNQHEAA